MKQSKREIERQVEELEPDPPSQYPVLDNLAELWAYDWESVEENDHLLRREETGQIYYYPPDFEQLIKETFGDE